jgi:HD-GYP domain-containing protein (c-di-GMP phosphodiesterase class II)
MNKFIKVNIDMIQVDEVVDFNIFIYLQLNNKFVHLVKTDSVVDNRRIERCKVFKINELWVPLIELYEFETYLKKWGVDYKGKFEVISLERDINGGFGVEYLDLGDKSSPIIKEISLKSEDERKEIAETLKELAEMGSEKETFYQEEAKAFIDFVDNDKIPSVEKRRLAKEKAKELVEEVFIFAGEDIEENSNKVGMLQHCKKTVASFVRHASAEQSVYDDIVKLKGGNGSYSHSEYVSTFSVLFAMGIGIHDKKLISEIGLGGLLHDLGLTKINDPSLMLREDELNETEMEDYKKHCEAGVHLLEASNQADISDKVKEIIMNHHEHYDGSGFPKGLARKEISDYVTIVSIADRFDMLTNAGLHPLEALQRLRDENDGSLGKRGVRFNPRMLNEILNCMNLDERLMEMEKKAS